MELKYNTKKVSHLNLIVRNPFDTLLSATNYLRISLKKDGLTKSFQKSINLIYPEIKVINNQTFPDFFILDNLRDQGHLDNALDNFTKGGNFSPLFDSMSSSWKNFYESYLPIKTPKLLIKFEDLVSGEKDNWELVSRKIADFISSDPKILENSFLEQRKNVLREKQLGSIF